MAELTDSYGRRLNYARISVTDRCNFRCAYCMPTEGIQCLAHDDIMRYEEILFLARNLHELGVGKIRVTGGEPLVRKGLTDFIRELRNMLPDIKITLTTNASLLKQHIRPLADAGINSLNISLDTLDPQKFGKITRLGELQPVLDSIDAAAVSGIDEIKLNTVLIRGFNDTEVEDIIAYANERKILPRFIEFMPLESDVWSKDSFISWAEAAKSMRGAGDWEPEPTSSDDDGPARYYKNSRSGYTVGVISAVSEKFCRGCNRIRISASGNLRTCLFDPSETPLRDLLIARDPRALQERIINTIKNKPRYGEDVRDGALHMSNIGG
ncbi:MAG: GTP 3',8-cyclase MoaA [Synergistaceae bacterium]|nr:GTP 3',8-cyclase MoaA [Synergistaceae bacterium]